LDFDAIEKVIVNNHHHRVLPIEQNHVHMEWECGLGINGGAEVGYDDEENILGSAERHELSHHLAHAYSAATQSPFDSGMVVVMDGMGETYRAMLRAEMTGETSYTSDLSFGLDSFQCIPSDLKERSRYSHFDFREAESVYVFEKKERGMDIRVCTSDAFVLLEMSRPLTNSFSYHVYSRCSNDLQKKIRRQHFTTTALRTWTAQERCIRVHHLISLVTGILVGKSWG
jgi:hypothetical protein